ncbi:MAG: hypothetical protein R3F59_06525 [Myxococcota bacterium]
MSVAVKLVPVDLGGPSPTDGGAFGGYNPDTGLSRGPNRAPRLVPDPGIDDPLVHRFDLLDPDGDEVAVRSFVTAGGVYQQVRGQEVWVQHQDPALSRDGVLYVVAEDGLGGTAVGATTRRSTRARGTRRCCSTWPTATTCRCRPPGAPTPGSWRCPGGCGRRAARPRCGSASTSTASRWRARRSRPSGALATRP